MADRNLFKTKSSVTRDDRESLLGQRGAVVWFTGLSGAGKSTLSLALEEWLIKRRKLTYLLDGDTVRLGLNKDLGFSQDDRVENIRRIAELANLFADCGVICITAFISPFRNSRESAKTVIGEKNFFIIYLSTPLEVCEERDPKGLYSRARRGDIPNFTGISSPYEEPLNPDLSLDTSLYDVDSCLDKIIKLLVTTGVLPEAVKSI